MSATPDDRRRGKAPRPRPLLALATIGLAAAATQHAAAAPLTLRATIETPAGGGATIRSPANGLETTGFSVHSNPAFVNARFPGPLVVTAKHRSVRITGLLLAANQAGWKITGRLRGRRTTVLRSPTITSDTITGFCEAALSLTGGNWTTPAAHAISSALHDNKIRWDALQVAIALTTHLSANAATGQVTIAPLPAAAAALAAAGAAITAGAPAYQAGTYTLPLGNTTGQGSLLGNDGFPPGADAGASLAGTLTFSDGDETAILEYPGLVLSREPSSSTGSIVGEVAGGRPGFRPLTLDTSPASRRLKGAGRTATCEASGITVDFSPYPILLHAPVFPPGGRWGTLGFTITVS